MTGNTQKNFFSNQVEALFLLLKEQLFAPPSGFFTRRIVVVPSQPMKTWLMLKMADDPSMGIAAGLEICLLQNALGLLSNTKKPDRLETALAIEHILVKAIQERRQEIEPLAKYLGIELPFKRMSGKSTQRTTLLSIKLADLFSRYGVYGKEVVEGWKEDSGWQEYIWKQLYKEKPDWQPEYIAFDNECQLKQPHDTQIHLFALSFVSKTHYRFLEQIASHTPVYYYILSPCQAFWTDSKSNREARALCKLWQKKNASEGQIQELEEYLRDTNPLLANFGRLGREMAEQLEESAALSQEVYLLPEEINEMPAYQELQTEGIFFYPEAQLSLLKAIQADMALLRNPRTSSQVPIADGDDSIQIHSAASPFREVEVIYDLIMGLIHRHSSDASPLRPQDFLVMALEISDYAPFIKAVFSGKDGELDAQITDLKSLSQSQAAQAFLHLIEMSSGRWEADSLLQLLDYSCFRTKFGITKEEQGEIREWIEAACISWGMDAEHRDELLKSSNCPNGILDKSPCGTWAHGLSRLLSGLAMTSNGEAWNTAHAAMPVEGISGSQTKNLGKFIHLLYSLKDDLSPLQDGTEMTLGQWGSYLLCLLDSYFAPSAEYKEEESEFPLIREKMGKLAKASESLPDERFAFATIKIHLDRLFEDSNYVYRENHVKAVKFCSLLPMRAVPAKAIILIGMQSGLYPKQAPKDSLDLVKGHPKADYCPSSLDFDRFLFLEALLSARDYFLITYPSFNAQDGQQAEPSVLVGELLDYMQSAFQDFPKEFITRHPFSGFDRRYFSQGSRFQGFRQLNYLGAKALQEGGKKDLPFLLKNFQLPPAAGNTEGLFTTTIQALKSHAKDPFKTYMTKTLGIYIEEEKKERQLFITHLDKYKVKKDLLGMDCSKVLEAKSASGELPIGHFKNIIASEINDEAHSLHAALRQENVDCSALNSCVLVEGCRTPYLDFGTQSYILPPIFLTDSEGQACAITGKLENISTSGILFFSEGKKEDFFKLLPEILVFLCILKGHSLRTEPQGLFYKKTLKKINLQQIEEPESLLAEFVAYYRKSLQSCSPVFPDLLNAKIESCQIKFTEAILKKVNQKTSFANPYFDWVYKGKLKEGAEVHPGEWFTAGLPSCLQIPDLLAESKGKKP